jgi:hypothetical protein
LATSILCSFALLLLFFSSINSGIESTLRVLPLFICEEKETVAVLEEEMAVEGLVGGWLLI